ncbi:GTPase IMAP family member 9-like [Kryptolebias marmoratus]|nr:GTPase IMAP family member 9-like [Kryptolebias marmoratus]
MRCCQTPGLRLVVIGKKGYAKDSVVRILRNKSEVTESPSEDLKTGLKETSSAEFQVQLGEHHLTVVDSPGFCDPNMKEDEEIRKIKKCVIESSHHVFLLVLKTNGFIPEDKKMLETVKSMFGPRVTRSMILVFTADRPGTFTENFLSKNEEIRKLDEECKKRHVTFYTEEEEPSEIQELQEKLLDVMKTNSEGYTYHRMRMVEDRVGMVRRVTLIMTAAFLVGAGVGAALGFLLPGAVGYSMGALIGCVVGGIVGLMVGVSRQFLRERFCI